jgi:hypothetical protein
MGRDERRRGRGGVLLVAVSAALLLYAGVGVAVQLRLLPLMVTGALGWAGLPSAFSAPVSLSWVWLSLLRAHYDSVPWLPWAAWLAGAGLLAYGYSGGARGAISAPVVGRLYPGRRYALLAGAVLLALLMVAGYARMSQLWPQDYGISRAPYDDEGVYAGASQLILQGIIPYRDYFFAHPPLAAISYAPAMAYHFNQWGSPTSFMMGRYLSVGYSLVTLALIFLIGLRLAGLGAGTLAGVLWALDGRVVEINRKVMLDGPMVLLSCAGLLFYLWARDRIDGTGTPRHTHRWTLLLLFLAGACATLSALTKIAGVACLIAILADMGWLWAERRGGMAVRGRGFAVVLGGALVAALAALGPFLLLAPQQLVRQVFFFQLLRPSDGLMDAPARIADLSSTLSNALTLLAAAGGLLLLCAWVLVRREAGAWRVVVLWTFFSLLLFTLSRSFYSHYYIQLAAPLCLMGGAVSLIAGVGRWPTRTTMRAVVPVAALSVVLLAVVALPLAVVQWHGMNTRLCPQCEDRIFEIVGRYVNNAVPPGTPVLSTDEQFNFLAARPPSRNATGYLIDSYGHMIYLGLGLDRRGWGDLWGAVLSGEHSTDVYAVIQHPEPQADFLDRAGGVPLIVVHDKGFARLTDATLAALEARNTVVERQARYVIFRKAGP